MRVTADVYDSNGNKTGIGPVIAIKSASVTEQLDGAGSFNLDLAVDERVLTLINETEVRLQVQTYDAQPSMEWVRGIVRDNQIQDEDSGTRISVSGPDTMDALTERTVGLGRSYNNTTMSAIINGLVGLVPGWSTTIESAVATDLQSTRFDGANVLQALLRCTSEKGIHVRNGLTANTLEIGAFGSLVTNSSGQQVRAIKAPGEMSIELQRNDATIFIDRISRSSKSDDVVNWCIPIGAGEGSAALTLRDCTYAIYNEDDTLYRAGTASRYPVYRRTNANGIVEYYLDASSGARLRQATVAFKEIGPVSNDTSSKQLAANALLQAATAYLDRQKVALVCYKFSAKNVQTRIRPGDKILVQYQGRMEILDENRSTTPRLTYMEVNEPLWVLKVTKKISADVITHDFEVATVDRYAMDTTKIVVSMMEAIQARNVSVQTLPMVFPFMAYDTMQEGTAFGSGYNKGKKARMDLRINDYITDITRIELRFITLPLHLASRTTFSSPNYYTVFDVITSSEYPSGISVFINNVDVSAQVTDMDTGAAAPFNAGSNTATDNRINITDFILNAAGGIYQNHKIELHCEHRLGDISLGSPDPASPGTNASKGYAFMVAYVFGSMRATVEG